MVLKRHLPFILTAIFLLYLDFRNEMAFAALKPKLNVKRPLQTIGEPRKDYAFSNLAYGDWSQVKTWSTEEGKLDEFQPEDEGFILIPKKPKPKPIAAKKLITTP